MAGVNITVTQLYDKLLIAGLGDRTSSYTTETTYGYIRYSVDPSTGEMTLYSADEPVAGSHYLIQDKPSVLLEEDDSEHTFIFFEPYYDLDQSLFSYRLVKDTCKYSELLYPFLGGLVDSDNRLDYVGFFSDNDSILAAKEQYPSGSFVIISPGTSSDETPAEFPRQRTVKTGYVFKSGYLDTNPNPWFCDWKIDSRGAASAVNIADFSEGTTYSVGAKVIKSDGLVYVYTKENNRFVWVTSDPNTLLSYTGIETVGTSIPNKRVVLHYADLNDESAKSWEEISESNGITTINIGGAQTAYLKNLHTALSAAGTDGSTILDNEFDSMTDAMYYMVCVLKSVSYTNNIIYPLSATYVKQYTETEIPNFVDGKQYHTGNLCHYESDGTQGLYVRRNSGTSAPTNTSGWERLPETGVQIDASVIFLVEDTVEDSTEPVLSLVNTRALQIVHYNKNVPTGITVTIPELPHKSGTAPVKISYQNLPTNYGTTDPKNGGTMVGLGYNLYRGILKPIYDYDADRLYNKGDLCWLDENHTKSCVCLQPVKDEPPTNSSDFWRLADAGIAGYEDYNQSTVRDKLFHSEQAGSSNSIYHRFRTISKIQDRALFVGQADLTSPETVTVSDTSEVEPLTDYLYILTYYFCSVTGQTVYSNEYICQVSPVRSGVGRFVYGIDLAFFGIGIGQREQIAVEYHNEADPLTVEVSIPPSAGDRYVYLVLAEMPTGDDTDAERWKFPFVEREGDVGDTALDTDISATILAKTDVQAKFHPYAPTFSGRARFTIQAEDEIFPSDDLYNANRTSVIAHIQNSADWFQLPSVTWSPASADTGYSLRLFSLTTSMDIAANLKALLYDGEPCAFSKFQVIAYAHLPAKIGEASATLLTEFKLSFL